MNRIFLLFTFFFVATAFATAQNTPAITQSYLISRGTVESPIERKHAEEAEHVLSGILAQSAGTSGSRYSVFSLSPVISLLEEGKVEGVKTLITAKVNISVRVSNLVSSEALGAFDMVVTGSGKNRAEAITKAVQQLRNKKVQVTKEIAGFDQKIKNYYDTNCEKIAATARDHVGKKEFQAALAILHGVPVDAGCYATISTLKSEVFNSVQQQQCSNITRQADAFIAANNFIAALNTLSQIDAAAPCAGEVTARIAAIEAKVDAAQKEQWEWLFKFWATGAEAEKAKWNAYTALCLNWLRTNGKIEILDK